MKNEIIEELLSDLIAKCEEHMASPFKKKKEGVQDLLEPEDSLEIDVETPKAEQDEDEELDDDTLAKLMEAYKKSR